MARAWRRSPGPQGLDAGPRSSSSPCRCLRWRAVAERCRWPVVEGHFPGPFSVVHEAYDDFSQLVGDSVVPILSMEPLAQITRPGRQGKAIACPPIPQDRNRGSRPVTFNLLMIGPEHER